MPSSSPHSQTSSKGRRALPIDHLRAMLILLVVAHHAVLAYVSFAPPPAASWQEPPMIWRAFPVVDTARTQALDILVIFNDVVLMALLFFVAGLFTWRSLRKKGAMGFLGGRSWRLGLPFLVYLGLTPLAYYPAYLQHGGDRALGAYWRDWLSLPVWPAGPGWFLWLLLAFSVLAAASYRLAPEWAQALGARLGPLGNRPWTFFGLLVAASAVVYLPVSHFIDPAAWFEYGPFSLQSSRVLLYALYFVFGIALGAYGADAGLLSTQGPLARRWWIWHTAAWVFLIVLIVCIVVLTEQARRGVVQPLLPLLTNLAFVFSCAASSLMLLSLFVRYGHWSGRLWRSLDLNAYGIYLAHYVFVSWLQFGLLRMEGPGILKALAVFAAAALLSWVTSATMRRIPAVAKVI